jgi:DNA-directed RNA polymerase subunit beta
MLTIKSDDVVGRARAFEAILKGTDSPESTVPESFKVLVRELNSLGLGLETKGAVVIKETEEDSEKARELAKIAGAEVVATQELTNPAGPMEIEEAKA